MSAQIKDQIKGVLTEAARGLGAGNGQVTRAIDRASGQLAEQFDAFREGVVAVAKREAVALGATEGQVDAVLKTAGLVDEPEAAQAAQGDEVPVTRAEFDRLLAFARRNGYTG